MSKFLYTLCRLALLLLTIAFASFFLITIEGMSFVQPVVDYATKYLPVLLIPVTIAMTLLLLLRYLGKGGDEKLGFEDFFAGLIAVALQLGILIVWRAQGNVIAGDLASNIPDVTFLTENAGTVGVLGIAIAQLLAFVFYCIASPDPKADQGD